MVVSDGTASNYLIICEDRIFSYFFVFFIVFIFCFKLGLPPFIFWKLRVFESTPFWFLLFYNVPYFLTLVLVFFSILGVFSSTLGGIFTFRGYIFYTLFLFLTLTLLFLVSFLPRTTNLASFLVISSSLTSFLVFSFLLILAIYTQPNTAPLPNYTLFLYLFFYGLVVFGFLVVFSSTTTPYFALNAGSVSFLSLVLVRFGRGRTQLRVFYLFIVLSLAGLPPLTSFFLKLRILADFFSLGAGGAPFYFIFVIYVFLSIYFYYRTLRYVLLPTDSIIKAKPADQSPNYSITNRSGYLQNSLTFHPAGRASLLSACVGGLGLCAFATILSVGVFFFLDFFLVFSFLV